MKLRGRQLIAAEEFCSYYSIDRTFIAALCESGLIEVTSIRKKIFLDTADLHQLEKLSRLHYDLDINVEGLEAINHLLKLIERMQSEISELNHRLELLDK